MLSRLCGGMTVPSLEKLLFIVAPQVVGDWGTADYVVIQPYIPHIVSVNFA